jgi:hypothetical protein
MSGNESLDRKDPRRQVVPVSRYVASRTYLNVSPPRIITARNCMCRRIIHKLRILPQAPPQTILLPCVITLVDQMALIRKGVVSLENRAAGPLPRLRLESTAIAQAEMDGLDKGAEECRLVLRVPAEARVAVLAGTAPGTVERVPAVRTLVAPGTRDIRDVIVVGHDRIERLDRFV